MMKQKVKALFKNSQLLSDRLTLTLLSFILASALMIIMGVTIPTVYAGQSGSNGGQGGYNPTMSALSSTLTKAFNDRIVKSMTKGTTSVQDLFKYISDSSNSHMSYGNIGNVLGFSEDATKSPDASEIWEYSDSTGGNTLSINKIVGFYDVTATKSATLSSIQSKTPDIKSNPMLHYILFGQALSAAGIDETTTATNTTNSGIRAVIGYGLYGSYILAYTAGSVMDYSIDLLSAIDIWGFIVGDDISGDLTADAAYNYGNLSNAPLIQTIRGVYHYSATMRIVILGLMITLFIASITVFKSKSYNAAGQIQQKGRKLFIRVIIMFIGVPLTMMVYHEGLEIIDAVHDSTQSKVSKYVLTSLIDFEGWTNTPEDAFMINPGGGYSNPEDTILFKYYLTDGTMDVYSSSNGATSSVFNGEKLSYSINATVYTDGQFTEKDISKITSLTGVAESGDYESLVNDASSTASTAAVSEHNTYDYCRDLIMGYAHGNTIDAAKYTDVVAVDANKLASAFHSWYISTGGVSATDEEELGNLVATSMNKFVGYDTETSEIWGYVDGAYGTSGKGEPIVASQDSNELKANLGKVAFNGEAKINGSASTKVYNTVLSANEADNKFTIGTISTKPASSGTATDHVMISMSGDVKLKTTDFSSLELYNYMNSSFANGTLTVYNPTRVSNGAVGVHHYSVSATYSGLTEIINLLFTFSILFSLGILGWIFGISMLMNILVEFIKATPALFRMLFGGVGGFVQSLLVVMAALIEILFTILLYDIATQIIDFMIKLLKTIINFMATLIATGTGSNDNTGVSSALTSSDIAVNITNVMIIIIILYGTILIIRWRKAIIISFKSMMTSILNGLFGTNEKMPAGAGNGLLAAVGAGAAAATIAHGLATDGTLDDVVSDLTGGEGMSDALKDGFEDIKDNLEEGDYAGAIDAAKDTAENAGGIMRGKNYDSEAQKEIGDNDSIGDVNKYNGNGYTDAQQSQIDKAIADGDFDKATDLQNQYDQQNFGGSDAANHYREFGFDQSYNSRYGNNGSEASTYASKLQDEEDQAYQDVYDEEYSKAIEEGMSHQAAHSIAHAKASRAGDLNKDGSAGTKTFGEAYTGSTLSDGGANGMTYQTMAGHGAYADLSYNYDENGLNATQAEQIDQMVTSGEYSDAQIAEQIGQFASANFGKNYQQTVQKINQQAGRSNSAVYGSSINDTGEAHTMTISSNGGSNGAVSYNIQSDNGGTSTILATPQNSGGFSYETVTGQDTTTVVDVQGGNNNTVYNTSGGMNNNSGMMLTRDTMPGQNGMPSNIPVNSGGGSVGGGYQPTVTPVSAGVMGTDSRYQSPAVNAGLNGRSIMTPIITEGMDEAKEFFSDTTGNGGMDVGDRPVDTDGDLS